MKNKKFIIILILSILVGFITIVINNANNKSSIQNQAQDNSTKQVAPSSEAETPNSEKENTSIIDSSILKIKESEPFLGDKNAPITIIEYASLSCPHCAMFYREAFELLKTEYIETGKVKFVYRDFPLNQQALIAAMVADCRMNDEKENSGEHYYGLIKTLFKTQDVWAFDQKYPEKLASIAKLDGMSDGRFKSCIEDQKLQNKILQLRMEAAKGLQIKSTPTFFINSAISEGYVDYLTIKKIIDQELSKIKK